MLEQLIFEEIISRTERKNYSEFDVQETRISLASWGSIEDPLKPLGPSLHYDIEGFKEGPQLGARMGVSELFGLISVDFLQTGKFTPKIATHQ